MKAHSLFLCPAIVGLMVVFSNAAIITTNVAPSGSIIDSSPAYNSSFAATNVLDGRTDEATSTPPTYWITPDGLTNAYLILDLRRVYPIKSMVLFNTHNRNFNDRGTKEFQVRVANAVEPKPVSGSVDRYFSLDGDVNDHSDNALTGTYLDANLTAATPTFSTNVPAAVKTGQSISLTGGGDNVEIPDTFQPTSFSISLWVNFEVVQASSLILRTASSGNQGSTWSHQIRLNSDGNFEAYLWDGAEKTVRGTTVVEPKRWYHVAATAANSGQMHLYVDGNEEGFPASIGTMWAGGALWALGTSWGSVGQPFGGNLDEVGIWFSSPLSPALIKRLSNGEKPSAVANSTAAPQGLRLVQPTALLSGTLSDVSSQDQITADVFTKTNGLTELTARFVEVTLLSANNDANNLGLNELQVLADVDDTPPAVGIDSAVLVNWPNNPFGYVLQSSPSLSAPAWTPVTGSTFLSDTNLALFLPANSRTLFYRLVKP